MSLEKARVFVSDVYGDIWIVGVWWLKDENDVWNGFRVLGNFVDVDWNCNGQV